MEIAFVAHSSHCALLLDGGGVCRWFVMKDDDEAAARSAKRCVGAQFVASLDPEAEGLLVHEPKVGTSLLFAANVDGRISLVRFGPLLSLDELEPGAKPVRLLEDLDADDAKDEAVTGAVASLAAPIADVESDTTLQRSVGGEERDEQAEHDDEREDRDHRDERDETEDQDAIATTIGWRSGFGIRTTLPSFEHDPEPEPEADTDVATRRFARDREEEAPPVSKRRGILPRRKTG